MNSVIDNNNYQKDLSSLEKRINKYINDQKIKTNNNIDQLNYNIMKQQKKMKMEQKKFKKNLKQIKMK